MYPDRGLWGAHRTHFTPRSSHPVPDHAFLPPPSAGLLQGWGLGLMAFRGRIPELLRLAGAVAVLLRDLEEITSPLWPQASISEDGS